MATPHLLQQDYSLLVQRGQPINDIQDILFHAYTGNIPGAAFMRDIRDKQDEWMEQTRDMKMQHIASSWQKQRLSEGDFCTHIDNRLSVKILNQFL
jgi:hypothetical protein